MGEMPRIMGKDHAHRRGGQLPDVQISQQGNNADDDDDDLHDLPHAAIKRQALNQVQNQDDDKEGNQNPD